jgi:hypothetical protein
VVKKPSVRVALVWWEEERALAGRKLTKLKRRDRRSHMWDKGLKGI